MPDTQPKPPRGSFPKGPPGETTEQRRQRYEQFVLASHSREPDYEAQSIRFYRGRTKLVLTRPGAAERKKIPAAPSRKLCATSRCWQCEHGDDDSNGHLRIANCQLTKCGLWVLRRYQEFADVPPAPRSGRGDYIGAIRTHCLDCVGGKRSEVPLCSTVTCALFPVRSGAAKSDADTETGQPETEAGDD